LTYMKGGFLMPEAKHTVSTVQHAVTEQRATTTRPQMEGLFSIQELTNQYHAFQTSREIVSVALRLAGKDRFSFSEATKIVHQFQSKEV